tara:strand:+ start:2187 stop:2792 length:606 start_codon:yes stop_codon:yes gene_type:complete
MEIVALFGDGVGISTLDVDNEKILNNMKNLEFKPTDSALDGDAHCQTSFLFNVLNQKEFATLKENIIEKVNQYIQDALHYEIDFQIFNSWCTCTFENGGFSQKHLHSNSWLSGVYYPEDYDAGIRFYRPIPQHWSIHTPKEFNFLNQAYFDIFARKNRLILFSSTLEHSVLKNNENKKRFSLAFNLVPKGPIGFGDSRIIY